MLESDGKTGAAPGASAIGAGWISAGLHAVLAVLIGAIVREGPIKTATVADPTSAQPIVWLERAGDIGGGGRRGNRTPEPAPPAEQPGHDRLTIPARVAMSVAVEENREPPLQQIDVPVMPEASGLREVAGNLTAVSIADTPGGPGMDSGAGDGDGPGFDRGRNGG